MPDNYLDQLIREKLAAWEVDASDADWEAFADRMGEVSAASDTMEQVIRERLFHHVSPMPVDGWERMEGLLDHPEDLLIRQQLRQMELAYDPTGWRDMNTLLNQPAERVITQKLTSHQEAYRAKDWRLMLALLGGGKPLYRRLLPMVMLALIFLAGWWWQRNYGGDTAPVVNIEQGLSHQQYHKPHTQASPIESKTVQSDDSNKLDAAQASSPALAKSREVSKVSTQSPTAWGSQHGFDQKFHPKAEDKVATPSLERPSEELLMGDRDKKVKKNTFTLAPLETTGGSLPIKHDVETKWMAPHESLAPPRPTVSLGLQMSRFSSAAQFNDPGLPGFSLGPKLELHLNQHLSLVSGLYYTQKSYKRMLYHTAEEMTGQAAARVALPPYWYSKMEARYKALEIPMLIKWRFDARRKISFYLQAGLSGLITLREAYEIYDPQAAVNSFAADFAPEEVVFEELNATRFIRHGNTYVGTLQFSPGFDWKINKSMQVQLEPLFQLGLQPTGAEQQKLHSVGLSFSWMYRLR